MSKPEIFTTAYVMDKEIFMRYGEDLSRHIADQLGQRIAEKIYQECQKGERIVSVGDPYSQDILELCQVETKMNVRVQELVRCRDCKYFDLNHWENFRGIPLIVAHEICNRWGNGCKTDMNGFCSMGEKKENGTD